jgi:cytochrome c peroxidase
MLSKFVPGALLLAASLPAQLPPVPVPAENPLTPEKVVLGKILFWDEQLSADDSTACGTCTPMAVAEHIDSRCHRVVQADATGCAHASNRNARGLRAVVDG